MITFKSILMKIKDFIKPKMLLSSLIYWLLLIAIPANSQISTPKKGKTVAVQPTSTVYDIRSFGAVSDTFTVNTKAIQTAIDRCSATGGGVVLVAGGNYVKGAVLPQK